MGSKGEGLFDMRVVDKTRSSNLERYVSERLKDEKTILKGARVKQLNCKGEWGRVSMRRMKVSE